MDRGKTGRRDKSLNALEYILLTLMATVVYVYIGYPILIWVAGLIRRKPSQKAECNPPVSVIIAAYNEADVIRQTLKNKLDLDYPREKMEIIVVSDASTDDTDNIVESFARNGVRLIRQEPRQGKTAGLNRAVVEAAGEIIIFSDANSMYHKDAIKELVSNFTDPQVGYVTGKMEYLSSPDSHVGAGTSGYMKYENRLRELETAIGSVVGVDGGIDAVRKVLYTPMDPSLLPDFVLPLNIVEDGYRVVYEPNAILHEEALKQTDEEYRMRVRVALRAFHALWHKKNLFNPFRYGIYSLQLISHKLLRYLVGFFMIGIFLCSIAIQEPWSVAFAGLQAVCYLFAVIGLWQNRTGSISRGFRYPFYFCLINMASAAAFLKFLVGQKQVVWDPRTGKELGESG